MSSSGRCPAWFIGTLPGMVIGGAAPAWFHRDAARHVGFDIIDTRRCCCEEGCNRKEKVVESNGMRSEPFVFQAACCFLLLVFFPRCCALLRPPVVLFTLRRCVLPTLRPPFFLFMWCLYTAPEMSLACIQHRGF
ncbi:hypothetical protein RchiOBHm_Chr1g0378981 [Rosa chinensis]|uniref:Uncharacterized protein n=1 Tax=Rosa chinensis TaxID=74649 RepID=A0A2P6SNF2_ROSCH|nr:hypothetical protein RchiOBHm_Chr1g0378981 [Rosa chinensis]